MSTHPDAEDLDRTDELPQLDVVAYETAQPPELTDALSTTDTWLVEGLDEPGTETIVRTSQAGFPVPGGVDLSLNVERLRQRIQALEAELAAARRAQRETEEAATRIPNAERSELNSRLAAADEQLAHLRQQHEISTALIQRLQQQLRDQGESHRAQLIKADEAREADRLAAEQQRVSLEQQLERSTANFTSTADEHARLREALEESRELAAARARQIDELQRAVITENGKANVLARNLAAKLADYDIMSAMVTQRNATIASLERSREELDERLQQAFADAHRRTSLLDEANQRAASSDRLAADIAARDEQIAQLGLELEALRHQEQQSQRTCEALEENLREAASRSAGDQERLAALQARIDELDGALRSMTRERDEFAGLTPQLEARSAELAQATTELAEVKRDAVSVWSELQSQSGIAQTRQQELAEAHAAIEELQRSNQDLRRKVERLHAVSTDDTQLLNERNAELAQVRTQLQESASTIHGLETSLRARDTLIDDLRAEIRTAQDERGIMSEQLGKARARVKTMTQQIFNRDNRIATLKADLAVHIEALAAIRQDVDRMTPDAEESPAALPVERFLEPVNHDGEPILLNRRVMTIGRTNDNDIFIPSKMISRHHARLLVGPNAVIVEDAGSTNGCYVNDQLVKQHVLHEGDLLAIGDLKFRLGMRPAEPPGGGEVVPFGRRHDD
ncbi:MAG TPA: FHA domain-containing protein [Povalibacter sp.]|uniref:FHA domain-containing protein n=1 Tax=Povalibacter sp. TaxID=1962978 RepID=UPI002BD9E8BA|nr:FHA domain-containing protein [Povalibacter sp.]HMN44217.1 FHA domain-containing protein [Povalibacter sp.]